MSFPKESVDRMLEHVKDIKGATADIDEALAVCDKSGFRDSRLVRDIAELVDYASDLLSECAKYLR